MTARFETFEGEICGFGTTSGHRIVVGRWSASPFGRFADVMHEDPDGTRTLLAPNTQVADFVQGTYVFDAVRIVDVVTRRSAHGLQIEAGELTADIEIGGRTALGWSLHALPTALARSRHWCASIDPLARVLLRGVRTRGTAGNGRHEWYGATDRHRLTAVRASLGDTDLGAMADVWPPVRFGFSSTPRTPGIVAVTTTIREAVTSPADATP